MTKNEMRTLAKRNNMTLAEVREMCRDKAANDNVAEIGFFAAASYPLYIVIQHEDQSAVIILNSVDEVKNYARTFSVVVPDEKFRSSPYSIHRVEMMFPELDNVPESNELFPVFTCSAIARSQTLSISSTTSHDMLLFTVKNHHMHFTDSLDTRTVAA
jgi:hypothetical protein